MEVDEQQVGPEQKVSPPAQHAAASERQFLPQVKSQATRMLQRAMEESREDMEVDEQQVGSPAQHAAASSLHAAAVLEESRQVNGKLDRGKYKIMILIFHNIRFYRIMAYIIFCFCLLWPFTSFSNQEHPSTKIV